MVHGDIVAVCDVQRQRVTQHLAGEQVRDGVGPGGHRLTGSTLSQAGTDSTFQLRIIQALQQVDNIVGNTGSPEIGINAKWLVKINQGISAFTNPNSGGA